MTILYSAHYPLTHELRESTDFAELLERHRQTMLYSAGQLSQLSGIPKRTIVNWLDGTVSRPRNWQSIARVAAALRLSVDDTDRLLAAASYDRLARLAEAVVDERDRALLAHWPVVSHGARERSLLRQYLEKLTDVLGALPAYFPRDASARFAEFYVDPKLRGLGNVPNELAGLPMSENEGELWSTLRERTPRAVILGQPGMGKTWILKGEAIRLAQEALARGVTDKGLRLPIFIRLPDLAQMLTNQCTLEEILHAIAQLAAQLAPGLPNEPLRVALFRHLTQWPEQVALLLDALDEVPDRSQFRAIARGAIVLVGTATRMHLLLTSRTLGYAAAPVARYLGADVAELELAPSDNARIYQTIRLWFGERVGLASQLHIALRRAPVFVRQASNPLLLSLMCMSTTENTDALIKSRSELYEPVLRLLLEGRWRSFDLQLPESRIRLKLRLLEQVAWIFATHRDGWNQQLSGDVIDPLLESTHEARRLWRTWRPEWGAHYEGTLYELSEWDGILVKTYVPLDGAGSAVPYTFLHRSLQEYLVSRYLLRRYREDGIQAEEIQQFLTDKVVNGDWFVVVLLVIEHLAQWPESEAKALLELLSDELVAQVRPKPGHLDIVALELLLSLHSFMQHTNVLQTLVTRLLALMVDVDTSPQIRVHAGRLIARMGDPRPEVMDVDAIEWVEVPGGAFLMGSNPRLDPEAFAEEFPQFSLELPTFAIARHPISFAQFQPFYEDRKSGYLNPELWPEAIALGHWREGMVWRSTMPEPGSGRSTYYERWSTNLAPIGWPAGLANSPVAGMGWYEACAFVRWLDQRWRRLGKLADDEFLDLPSEAEWEKAARGVYGCIYPWGNEFDSNRLNWFGQMLMSMTPIGCFPNSLSPYGVEEMVGNLWEFTRSVYAPYGPAGWNGVDFGDDPNPTARLVLRGGAHFHVRTRCRAAARLAVMPYSGINSTFRIVKRYRNPRPA